LEDGNMPRVSQADREREEDILNSLKELRPVLVSLQAISGLSQNAIAEATQVNKGYLSDLLNKPDQMSPSLRKLEALTMGLRVLQGRYAVALLGTPGEDEIESGLATIERRFGWIAKVMTSSGEVMQLSATNYVVRECDAEAEQRIGEAATVTIFGPPQSGRTSLAKHVERLAAKRGQVAYVDVGSIPDNIQVWDGIARAIGFTTDLPSWEDLNANLKSWVSQHEHTSTLILDGFNGGPSRRVEEMLLEIRGWHQLRSSLLNVDRPWRRLAVWVVLTTHTVTHARYSSSAILSRTGGSAVQTRWWRREEIDQFVASYPRPAGKPSWPIDHVNELRLYFGGQPYLTHAATEACHLTGGTVADWIERQGATGPIHAHLVDLARLIATDPAATAAVVNADKDTLAEWAPILEDLGVAQSDGLAWSCRLYADRLPRYVQRAISRPVPSIKAVPRGAADGDS
jgi:transcriptional regulator with XRE-family HTH domain